MKTLNKKEISYVSGGFEPFTMLIGSLLVSAVTYAFSDDPNKRIVAATTIKY